MMRVSAYCRDGSKRQSSTLEALAENRAKLTPPFSRVGPRGVGYPGRTLIGRLMSVRLGKVQMGVCPSREKPELDLTDGFGWTAGLILLPLSGGDHLLRCDRLR